MISVNSIFGEVDNSVIICAFCRRLLLSASRCFNLSLFCSLYLRWRSLFFWRAFSSLPCSFLWMDNSYVFSKLNELWAVIISSLFSSILFVFEEEDGPAILCEYCMRFLLSASRCFNLSLFCSLYRFWRSFLLLFTLKKICKC